MISIHHYSSIRLENVSFHKSSSLTYQGSTPALGAVNFFRGNPNLCKPLLSPEDTVPLSFVHQLPLLSVHQVERLGKLFLRMEAVEGPSSVEKNMLWRNGVGSISQFLGIVLPHFLQPHASTIKWTQLERFRSNQWTWLDLKGSTMTNHKKNWGWRFSPVYSCV